MNKIYFYQTKDLSFIYKRIKGHNYKMLKYITGDDPKRWSHGTEWFSTQESNLTENSKILEPHEIVKYKLLGYKLD